MSRKIARTPETDRVEVTVLARSNDKRLRAVIKDLADARTIDGVLNLGFPHEFHYLLCEQFVVQLTEILGPVKVELLPMLAEGLKLGGILTSWE